MSPLQPYSVSPSAWTVSSIGGTQAKAVRVSPRVLLPVWLPARDLLLGTDSHYVDPVSSTKRVLAPTGLAERKLTPGFSQ